MLELRSATEFAAKGVEIFYLQLGSLLAELWQIVPKTAVFESSPEREQGEVDSERFL